VKDSSKLKIARQPRGSPDLLIGEVDEVIVLNIKSEGSKSVCILYERGAGSVDVTPRHRNQKNKQMRMRGVLHFPNGGVYSGKSHSVGGGKPGELSGE